MHLSMGLTIFIHDKAQWTDPTSPRNQSVCPAGVIQSKCLTVDQEDDVIQDKLLYVQVYGKKCSPSEVLMSTH